MPREVGDRGLVDEEGLPLGGIADVYASIDRPATGRGDYPSRPINADTLPSEFLEALIPGRPATGRGDFPSRESVYSVPTRPNTARSDYPTRGGAALDPLAMVGDLFSGLGGSTGYYANPAAFNVPAVVPNEGGGGGGVSPVVIAGGVGILGVVAWFMFKG